MKCAECAYIGDNFHKSSYYCKPCANARSRKWHANNKHKLEVKNQKRNSYIKLRHGLTLDEYTNKLLLQNSKCKICELDLPAMGFFTHLDHNHTTGKLRDFLCTNCNRGLGHFQDNKELLMKAAAYLDSHTENGNQKEGRCL